MAKPYFYLNLKLEKQNQNSKNVVKEFRDDLNHIIRLERGTV